MGTRRQFLKLTISGTLLLCTSGIVKAFPGQGKLPPKRKVKLRFAVASDGHFGQPNTPFESTHAEMVQWINAEAAGRGLDFTFINGDLYHDDASFAPVVKEYWSKLSMPWYVSHGNHDHGSEMDWEKTWGNPWHYSFNKSETGFVVLNTADETGKYICPDIEKTTNLLTKYQHYQQLFLFMHITPIKWTGAGIDCPEITALFNQQTNLKAIFHGHDHDQDNVKEKDGKHYFFDSHIGGSWGTNYRGYRIVEIMKNGDVLTYQVNPAKMMQVNQLQLH